MKGGQRHGEGYKEHTQSDYRLLNGSVIVRGINVTRFSLSHPLTVVPLPSPRPPPHLCRMPHKDVATSTTVEKKRSPFCTLPTFVYKYLYSKIPLTISWFVTFCVKHCFFFLNHNFFLIASCSSLRCQRSTSHILGRLNPEVKAGAITPTESMHT